MKFWPFHHPAARHDGQALEGPVAGAGSRQQCVLAVLAFALMSCVAISGRSFWIDEAATAVQARQPSLESWWQLLVQEKTAHLQMPLYMLYVWACEKVFGSGEWTLRAANLPWFVAGAVAFTLAFPAGDRRRPIAACVVLACPFAWYYLDEARPYAMELGASLLAVASIAHLAEASRAAGAGEATHLGLLLFGLVTLSGCSLLGMVWAGAGLAALPALLSWPRVVSLVKRCCFLWITAATLLLVLAGYYLWTLSVGARASAAATTTWGSVVFVGYELLGFGGLGPGRLEMRTAGPAALRGHWGLVAVYALAVGVLLSAALGREIRSRNRRHLVLALCCAVPAAFILGVGFVAHFRVLGRHFTPFVPVLLYLFTSGLWALWSRRSAWARGVALLFCGLSLASSFLLRFSPRHEKDNYRAAAALAKTALREGQSVWWNAAPEGARYYGVPLTNRPGSAGAAFLVLNPTRETLRNMPTPQIIVTSKPDIYDGQSFLGDYARRQSFHPAGRFNAFVIWSKDQD